MQQFTEIQPTDKLSQSREPLMNNDKTALSCNEGSVFPTTNLILGMLCFRSDQGKLYQLIDVATPTWKLIFDLNKTATDKEYVDSVAATKQNVVTGAASSVMTSNLTASRVVVSDANGKISPSTITTTQLGYLSGLTGNIQTQLDGKLNSGATAVNATKWDGGSKTISTAAPSGGSNGDVWFRY